MTKIETGEGYLLFWVWRGLDKVSQNTPSHNLEQRPCKKASRSSCRRVIVHFSCLPSKGEEVLCCLNCLGPGTNSSSWFSLVLILWLELSLGQEMCNFLYPFSRPIFLTGTFISWKRLMIDPKRGRKGTHFSLLLVTEMHHKEQKLKQAKRTHTQDSFCFQNEVYVPFALATMSPWVAKGCSLFKRNCFRRNTETSWYGYWQHWVPTLAFCSQFDMDGRSVRANVRRSTTKHWHLSDIRIHHSLNILCSPRN